MSFFPINTGGPGMFGPLPSEPQESRRAPRGGFADLLYDVFAGPADPRLSAEQNEALRKRALIMAGLQMMATAGQGGSTGEVLLGGAQGGFQQYQQQAQLAQQQASQQRMAEIAQGNYGPEQLQQIYLEAVQSGDTGVAQTAATLLNQRGAQSGATAFMQGPPLLDENGQPVRSVFDPNTGRYIPTEFGVPPTASQIKAETPPTEAEIRKQRESLANPIRDDFRAAVKDYGVTDIVGFYQTGVSGLGRASGFGDVQAVQSIAKLMDPGSVVREGEFRVWAERAGLPQRVQTAMKQVDEGVLLTQPQRDELRQILDETLAMRRAQFQPVLQQFSNYALQQGLDPADVVVDPYTTLDEDMDPFPQRRQ